MGDNSVPSKVIQVGTSVLPGREYADLNLAQSLFFRAEDVQTLDPQLEISPGGLFLKTFKSLENPGLNRELWLLRQARYTETNVNKQLIRIIDKRFP